MVAAAAVAVAATATATKKKEEHPNVLDVYASVSFLFRINVLRQNLQ